MTSYLRAESLLKSFGGLRALDGATLDVHAPGVTVLLGPNGAGKSTLFACAAGLLKPDLGALEVLGRDPAARREELVERVAYVPDHLDVPAWMTAEQLGAFLASQRTRLPEPPTDDGERWLERFGVPRGRPLSDLSRGQAAKARLALALAQEPELLLLDEPFGGLDPVARRELLSLFLEHFEGGERAAIVATHDLETAARIADHVVLLAEGRVVRSGPIADLVGENGSRIPDRLLRALEAVA